MNFQTSEITQQVAQSAKDFALQYIKPHLMEWDESQVFPIEIFKEMGKLGLMGVLVPEKYGGTGLSYFEYNAVIQEISKVCGSIGLSLAAHNSLCTGHILAFGNEEQKQKYLPKLASAEFIGAWGLTEPNTGSDAGNMQTTAVQDGDNWIINGAKSWITHGRSGDVAVVVCRTGEPRARETAEMIFDNCIIPDANRLGNIGEGFKQSMKVLDGGRISIAALSLGIARGAYEAALQYSKERHQFDQPISNFQGISFKLADMATKIECASLLINQACDLKIRGEKMTKESAMAKYYASEVAVRVSTIGEGTSEIQKIVISREVLK